MPHPLEIAISNTKTGAEEPPAEITVTVKQKGKPELSLKAPSGANLRNLLTDNGINVYQSITRWTNCKGKQLCGYVTPEVSVWFSLVWVGLGWFGLVLFGLVRFAGFVSLGLV